MGITSILSTTQQQIITVAAVLTATLVITTFIKKFLNVLKRISHFFDDFFGEEERDGVPSRPGISKRLSDIETLVYELRHHNEKQCKDIELIKSELYPNHGSSLRDAVNRIEKRLTDVEDDLK